MFKLVICVLAVVAALAERFPAWEAKNYAGGSFVEHEGVNYKAKWWCNPDQVPGTPVEFEHQTPWKSVGPAEGGSGPAPSDKAPTVPAPTAPATTKPATTKPATPTTQLPPPSGGDVPEWVRGGDYDAFDKVSNGGKIWSCKKWPANGWCKEREPSGHYGATAWDLCTGSDCGSAPGGGKGKGNPNVPTTKATLPPPATNPPRPTGSLKRSVMEAEERRITNVPLIRKYKSELAYLSEDEVALIAPGRAANPENVKRLESIVSEATFEHLFPKRNAVFTYTRFLQGVGKFPRYCGAIGDAARAETVCRKSLSTSFAHFAQETGGNNPWWTKSEGIPLWRQALFWVREIGKIETTRNQYNTNCGKGDFALAYPCGKFENGEFLSYFGRGSKQLSWNYNYGPFSAFVYGDINVLLQNPAPVADTYLAFASAIWFFVYPQPPKPSMQSVVDGSYVPNSVDLAGGLTPGFGVTTNIINGGYECTGSTEVKESLFRIEAYRGFSAYLNSPIPADEKVGCANTQRFQAGGAASMPFYYGNGWNGNVLCQISTWDRGFNTLVPGDYERCIRRFNPTIEITED
eukprot:Filipodium_phascolosomae@DN356_c0_g1_i1.p1